MRKYIIINSAIIFSITAIAAMSLHECAHYIIAWLNHASNLTLHHNYVNYDETTLSINQRISIAAAGPIISLLIGIIFHLIVSKYKTPNLLRLFFLFFSIQGYIGFFGYLMIAPIFKYGDTGFICHALNFPIYLTIGIAISGLVILALIIKKIGSEFILFLTKEEYDKDIDRKIFFNSIIQYPLYLGIIITTILNLPVPTLASLIAPIFSPFSIMWCFGELMRKKYPYQNKTSEISSIDKISKLWILIFVIVVIINRLLAYQLI